MTAAHGTHASDWAHWQSVEGGYMFDRQALVEAYLTTIGSFEGDENTLPDRARKFIDAWPRDKVHGRSIMDEVFTLLLDRDVLHCPHGRPLGIDLATIPSLPWIPEGFLAGPAMGSGRAPWTRASLEAIERIGVAGDRVIDIGTGTGILALRCHSLGAATILGVDIDPLVRAIARHNVRRAGAERRIEISDRLRPERRDGRAPLADPQTGGDLSGVSCVIVALPSVEDILPALHTLLPGLIGGGRVIAGPMEGTAEAAHLDSAIRELGVRPIDIVEREGWYALVGIVD